ncbi:MAG: hypothetical protein Q9161_003804 [Pseudevernia consocians]
MEKPVSVQLLHIPAIPTQETPFSIISLDDIRISKNYPRAHHTETADLEALLGYIPDLRSYDHTFCLKHRRLFKYKLPDKTAPREWDGVYLVYKCTEPCIELGQELPRNTHFKKNARVYGDMFVFKLRKDRKGNASYDKMGVDIVDSFNREGTAFAILNDVATW